MLPKRVYKVLNYLKDFNEPLLPSETPFESDDFSGLKQDGYVSVTDRTTRLSSGEFSDPQKAYKITEKGKDALEIHDLEESRYAESRKISKSSRRWAIIAAAIGFIGIIVSIVLELLP